LSFAHVVTSEVIIVPIQITKAIPEFPIKLLSNRALVKGLVNSVLGIKNFADHVDIFISSRGQINATIMIHRFTGLV
jgi:hypothetical protein